MPVLIDTPIYQVEYNTHRNAEILSAGHIYDAAVLDGKRAAWDKFKVGVVKRSTINRQHTTLTDSYL